MMTHLWTCQGTKISVYFCPDCTISKSETPLDYHLILDDNVQFYFWSNFTTFDLEHPTPHLVTKNVNHVKAADRKRTTRNLPPDSPRLLCRTPRWLPGRLCSTWGPDCGSAPDQLCPKFQTWPSYRPGIPSESGRQLRGHKAEGAASAEPGAADSVM